MMKGLNPLRLPSPLVVRSVLTAIALLVAPSSARAYCRTTTVAPPATYDVSRGCFTEGLPLFWRGACTGYDLNRDAASYIPLATAQDVAARAFAAWSNVTCSSTGEKVGITAQDIGPVECSSVWYDPYGPNQNVVVFREESWPYAGGANMLGLTTVSYNFETGEIYDVDMEINATGGDLTTSDEGDGHAYDLLSVITHEAGHFFGLAHSSGSQATMYPRYSPGSTSLRTLDADDEAGICAIYPNASERIVDESIAAGGVLAATACDATPRHGFTSTCDTKSTPKDTSGCALARGSRSWSSPATFLVGAVMAIVARARRGRRAVTRAGRGRGRGAFIAR